MNFLQIPLFQDILENELSEMRSHRCMRQQQFHKNDFIFHTGEQIYEIGIILSGNVLIESTDLWGNTGILSSLEAGKVFAETYALCQKPILVDVVSTGETEILFLNLQLLRSAQTQRTAWYPKLLRNLLLLSARNNLALSSRIFCTAAKTVRSRVLTYLSEQAVQQDSMEITIPYNRQQMADYLNLDRSALSKELCRMRDDGLLQFRKNHFILNRSSIIP